MADKTIDEGARAATVEVDEVGDNLAGAEGGTERHAYEEARSGAVNISGTAAVASGVARRSTTHPLDA